MTDQAGRLTETEMLAGRTPAQVRQPSGAVAEIPRSQMTRQEQERMDRAIQAWRSVPDRLRTLSTFDAFVVSNPIQEKIVAAAREWCHDVAARVSGCEGLIFYGTCGTGKDHLALSCLREVAKAGYTVRRLSGPEFRRVERDRIAEEDTTETEILRGYLYADVLLISDPTPAVGSLTSHQASQLQDIVDHRYINNKPCVLTINAETEDQAAEELGVPTWQRIVHNAWVMKCIWPSHRMPARRF